MLELILAVFNIFKCIVKDVDYLKFILLHMSCFFTYLIRKPNIACGDFDFLIVNRRERASV